MQFCPRSHQYPQQTCNERKLLHYIIQYLGSENMGLKWTDIDTKEIQNYRHSFANNFATIIAPR